MQTVFRRYEKKYRLNAAQYAALAVRLAGRMTRDAYGAYTVFNLYYDTAGFDLIRASVEKPLYKEKLRLRCYESPRDDTPVFLELKKKYDGIVSKRRIRLPYAEARDFPRSADAALANGSQIAREIEYFLSRYPVSAKLFLAYERVALKGAEADGDLRITFDSGIRFRLTDLRLDSAARGRAILEDVILMEVKNSGNLPSWLCRILNEEAVFPASFSKYGFCYTEHILRDALGERRRSAHA
ncbi:MAG: polyphosphate polymerase domain-containing protein [Clostridiales Family XIII bacterium]|jgi:hypothetical protein|nr:polyphosphate polymerase domain-containing protein [Clostridiales Family XIII bacterium]